MKYGNRSFNKWERAPKELVDLFKGLPVANIDDNIGRSACPDFGIKPMGNADKILGTAFTVQVPAGDNLMVHKALDMLQPGDVLVVDGNSDLNRSLVGGLMCTYAYKKGCAGVVIDGVIRDVADLRELPMPVFARGSQANGPLKNGLGTIGVPVTIGGAVIYPGDIIVSDADGLIAIRPQDAKDIAEKAKATLEAETKLFESLNSTGVWPNRQKFMDAVTASGVEEIDEEWSYK